MPSRVVCLKLYIVINWCIFKICALKYMSLTLLVFLLLQTSLKKTKVKLDLLADINKLLMAGKAEEYATLFIDMQKLITNT